MAMNKSHDRDMTVTEADPIPIVVRRIALGTGREILFRDDIGIIETEPCPPGIPLFVQILPPGTAAKIVKGGQGKLLKELENKFWSGPLTDAEASHLLAIAHLVDAVRLNDPGSISKFAAQYRSVIPEMTEHGYKLDTAFLDKAVGNIKKWLVSSDNHVVLWSTCMFFNLAIQDARPCMWSHLDPKTRVQSLLTHPPRFGIYAENLTSALCLQLLFSLQQPVALAFCVACGKAYTRTRMNQTHCDLRCANRDRQRKSRERKRAAGVKGDA